MTTKSRSVELSRDECTEYLASGSFVGRVGFCLGQDQMILPVNYLLDGGSVLFSTHSGSLLSDLSGSTVAFEVDGNRPLDRAGWSVVVQGVVREITDPGELERMQRGPLHSWAWQSADRWFAIPVEAISGRRIGAAPQ